MPGTVWPTVLAHYVGGVATLEQLLARVSPARYQHERAQFEQRQARFRQRLRWRRNRAGVLEQLEAQWASLCANPT
jgi:hypothetical protein